MSDNAEIRQYIIELKTEFTVPVHESMTLATMKANEMRQDSLEDDHMGGGASGSSRRRRYDYISKLIDMTKLSIYQFKCKT